MIGRQRAIRVIVNYERLVIDFNVTLKIAR